jgi:dolichol-phosphate mannosyltransferase
MIYVVLPAYNEGSTIGPLLTSMMLVMKENGLAYTAIIVNDGSSDNTARVVSGYRRKMPVELISHKKNLGLAEAIKTGFLQALSKAKAEDIIVTMDSDNTQTPGLILRMVRMIREGHDVVIASRYQPGSRVKGVPFLRKLLSQAASLLFRFALPIKGVRDFTCGYRAYRVKVLRQALSFYGEDLINSPGFSCMVDILLKLRHFDVIAAEVPLILRYDLKHSISKMRVLKNIKDLLLLLAKRRVGIYR